MDNQIELTKKREVSGILFQELQTAIKEQARLFLIIGRLLKNIRDNHLYKYLGEGGNDNFRQFLQNPEVGLRQSTAYLYIRIFEYYIEELGLPEEDVLEVPLNRLMRLLPALKKLNNEEAREVVDKVKHLTNSDYDTQIKEDKLETERPLLYKHKECGNYVFEFRPVQMCKCPGGVQIIDKDLLD